MSLLFDNANNDYLTVAAAPVTAVPLTMSIVFYPDEDGTNWQNAFSLADSGSSTDYFQLTLLAGVANDPMRFYTRDSGSNVSASINGTNFNTWNHVVGVSASSTSRYCILNGNKSGENTTDVTPNACNRTRIAVAARSGGISGDDFSGRLAEAAVWNVVLDDDEIAALAAGYSPLLVRPGSLAFYLPMIRDDNEDLIGGLSFTANGTPTIAEHPRIIHPAPRHYSFPSGAGPTQTVLDYERSCRGVARGVMRGAA